MKIFFVNASPVDVEKSGIKRLLLSYGAVKSMRSSVRRFLETPGKYEIFLDSGAFQVHTLGQTIDLESYASFIKEFGFDFYANLDVIGNSEETIKNQERMEDWGLKPIRVYHLGEDFSFLDYYLEKYDYLALGGIVKRGSKKYNENWVKRCFWKIKDHWPKKIHGFGVTDLRSLETFPFYSSDSSSPVVSAAFGRIIEWRERKISYGRQQHVATGSRHPELVDDLIFSGSRGRDRAVYNLKVYLEIEQYITELWEKRGVTWKENGGIRPEGSSSVPKGHSGLMTMEAYPTNPVLLTGGMTKESAGTVEP